MVGCVRRDGRWVRGDGEYNLVLSQRRENVQFQHVNKWKCWSCRSLFARAISYVVEALPHRTPDCFVTDGRVCWERLWVGWADM